MLQDHNPGDASASTSQQGASSTSPIEAADAAGTHIPVPSVTAVLGVLDKGGLAVWAQRLVLSSMRQALLGRDAKTGLEALKEKRLEGIEWLDELIKKASAAPEEQKQRAADIGTRVHAAIDAYIQGRQVLLRPAASGGKGGKGVKGKGAEKATAKQRDGSSSDGVAESAAAAGENAAAAAAETEAVPSSSLPSPFYVEADVLPVLAGFQRWYAQSGLMLYPAGDTVVYSRTYRYAGAADCLGRRMTDGKLIVLDFKTSNAIHSSYALQLAAYAQAVCEMCADGELSLPALSPPAGEQKGDGKGAAADSAMPASSSSSFSPSSSPPRAPSSDAVVDPSFLIAALESGAGSGEAAPVLPLPRFPDGVEALVLRLDKQTGEVEEQQVTNLAAAFDAFKAALLLWHSSSISLLGTAAAVASLPQR